MPFVWAYQNTVCESSSTARVRMLSKAGRSYKARLSNHLIFRLGCTFLKGSKKEMSTLGLRIVTWISSEACARPFNSACSKRAQDRRQGPFWQTCKEPIIFIFWKKVFLKRGLQLTNVKWWCIYDKEGCLGWTWNGPRCRRSYKQCAGWNFHGSCCFPNFQGRCSVQEAHPVFKKVPTQVQAQNFTRDEKVQAKLEKQNFTSIELFEAALTECYFCARLFNTIQKRCQGSWHKDDLQWKPLQAHPSLSKFNFAFWILNKIFDSPIFFSILLSHVSLECDSRGRNSGSVLCFGIERKSVKYGLWRSFAVGPDRLRVLECLVGRTTAFHSRLLHEIDGWRHRALVALEELSIEQTLACNDQSHGEKSTPRSFGRLPVEFKALQTSQSWVLIQRHLPGILCNAK